MPGTETGPTVQPRVPPAAVRRHWQRAELVAAWAQTATARSLQFRVPGWAAQLPGQHCMVRLTAPDGYTAQRSYSIASTASTPELIELVVERLADGEVSPHLHDVLAPGDAVQVRGPFGGHFVWAGADPVALIGGGSGVAPLMAMLRCWRERERPVPLRMVVSARGPEQLWFADEYGTETTLAYTRQVPPGWAHPPGRLDAATLRAALSGLPPWATAYVCGSHGFVEHAGRVLVAVGWPVSAIRIERFGPS